MYHKIICVTLIAFIVNLALTPSALAADKLSKEPKQAANVKAAIAKLGKGPDARIKVKLRDGTKLKGYVSEISENGFTITSDEIGTSTLISYSKAKQVRGKNNLTGEVIFIGVLFLVIVLVVAIGLDDSGK